MAASIGGTSTPAFRTSIPTMVGTTTMPTAARYSPADERRGSGVPAGRGCPSGNSWCPAGVPGSITYCLGAISSGSTPLRRSCSCGMEEA